jgi:hypothetical protein
MVICKAMLLVHDAQNCLVSTLAGTVMIAYRFVNKNNTIPKCKLNEHNQSFVCDIRY